MKEVGASIIINKLEPNKTFVLKKDDGLCVAYGFVPTDESITRLEYCLRMTKGELDPSLDRPLLESLLHTLKTIIETSQT